jgi:hypothetical protein
LFAGVDVKSFPSAQPHTPLIAGGYEAVQLLAATKL